MSEIKDNNKWDELARIGKETLFPSIPRVSVGLATCGKAAGGEEIYNALKKTLTDKKVNSHLVAVGCQGLCWAEPLVEIHIAGKPRALYGNVQIKQIDSLVAGIQNSILPTEGLLGLIYEEYFPLSGETFSYAIGDEEELTEHPFLKCQSRRVMSNCGLIKPASVAEYAATGGYRALQKAINSLCPEEIISMIEASGLRGRGGAGYPTGNKWRLTREALPGQRYFIVNADEGDPGAYMDRGLLESDPHRVLEGLAIGAYAIGADQAYIFIRSEYQLAIKTLKEAIAEAEEAGFLGKNVFGSDFSLKVTLIRSAGAYVCGEETAMLNVLENKRCYPSLRPPYPTEKGLWNAPTCINNVETLANIPLIVTEGPAGFSSLGTENSPGTKIFSIVGGIERPGLIEVPLGTTIDTIINTIGGAIEAKAIQIGGPSGAILPASLSSLPVDYESLQAVGGIMGSGGLVVLAQNQCVVNMAKFFLDFSVSESCGKCKPCREGLRLCAEMLERITKGQGSDADLEKLEQMSAYIAGNSRCGLGKAAPRPILSSLHYFRSEYEEHINGHCPGLVCKELIHFEIIQSKCQGERCCLQTCPGNAIKGSFGKPGRIVERLCTKCWMCTISCPYSAIRVYS